MLDVSQGTKFIPDFSEMRRVFNQQNQVCPWITKKPGQIEQIDSLCVDCLIFSLCFHIYIQLSQS